MSWFKELTNKAEALLVKLDQDAAQALQNPEGILPGLKQNNQDFETESANNYLDRSNIPIQERKEAELVSINNDESVQNTVQRHLDVVRNVSTSHQSQDADTTALSYSDQTTSSASLTTETEIPKNVIGVEERTTPDVSSPLLNSSSKDNLIVNVTETQESMSKTPSYSKKFTIQTSKTGSRPFVPSTSKRRNDLTKTNGIERPSRRQTPIENIGADDIRASINRSLQEYTHYSSMLTASRRETNGDSTLNSHFDNQPNLVGQSNHSNANETLLNRSNSSASFSIDVPDDQSMGGRSPSTDIAARLLKTSMSKRKKSTFYLHQVINRLANPSEATTPIFSDQTRIKLRRVQMRLASSMRRLNYYLQAYPMVKYLILIQLVIMQLLVIYVLFFYQSSGSASELSSQIKKQQQELSESQ